MPTTEPEGPTARAASRQSIPPPDPRSTTSSPGRRSGMADRVADPERHPDRLVGKAGQLVGRVEALGDAPIGRVARRRTSRGRSSGSRPGRAGRRPRSGAARSVMPAAPSRRRRRRAGPRSATAASGGITGARSSSATISRRWRLNSSSPQQRWQVSRWASNSADRRRGELVVEVRPHPADGFAAIDHGSILVGGGHQAVGDGVVPEAALELLAASVES